MTERVFRTPRAIADLAEIYRYIGTDNLSAAERFIGACEACFSMLAQFPESGRSWPSRRRELSGVRVLPVPDFRSHLVFYRPQQDGVLIIAVLHGARDLANVLMDLFENSSD